VPSTIRLLSLSKIRSTTAHGLLDSLKLRVHHVQPAVSVAVMPIGGNFSVPGGSGCGLNALMMPG
jgi:hypothetical protein